MTQKYYVASGNFNPEHFEWHTWFDNATPKQELYTGELTQKGLAMQALDAKGYAQFSGHCQHCGQRIRYCCVFLNTAHDELVVVGETCAEHRMNLSLNQFQIEREREAAQRLISRIENAKTREEWLAEDEARVTLIDWLLKQDVYANDFYCSLKRQYEKDGKLSDKQVAAIEKCKAREEKWKAQREEDTKNAKPAPNGRLVVAGEIVSLKIVHNQWGAMEKMTVKADGGYRFFCTVPNSLYDGETELKGSRVELTVTLKQSNDDPTFAWGKRPSKASFIK